ncbi:hypothetical protein GOP47_0013199 [Adiantum capillus-veneris]|uniref:RRM domain-containing protein n=1 Tax=Adiantum capillus-veneris TaxID=13818 RepID=A0A9D4UN21_ADICA|nr:hypothetical protein GOP47_0013199 [Adiantum capillus-veneris]
MRATRNAAKGTPPPAKKAGKATPGKGTPKAEKKEDNVTAEKEDGSKAEAVPVVQLSGSVDVAMADNKEEKPQDTVSDAPKAIEESEDTLLKQVDTEAPKVVEELATEKVAPPKVVEEVVPNVVEEMATEKDVGGLDKEATMEDVRRTFEAVGEVQEVRLMTNPESGKNKGYAFVRFATPEQAIRAATELDRTKIREKECAVVPSEENDTLFVGNICKSWSSEQITEKLKEYGVEGIDEMVVVEDNENEGHNRGHAFLEFVSHSDAIKAFKRLSKPDAIFGSDRSAKVAWAEGSSEPDEAVMVKVKSVFVSGLPEEWDDGNIREHFGKYGNIERIVLAKNIAKSKRTDYAFANFATRDAAVAAIEALNNIELTDGDNKVKLKVELAKPTPRKKRMRGYRGSYPVGGRPSKQKKGDGRGDRKKGEARRGDQRRGEGGRSEKRRGEGSRGISEGGRGARVGSEKNSRGTKRKGQDDRPLPEERSRDRHNRGSRNFRAGRVGSSSRQGRNSTYDDEDYMPLGARISPGYAPARGYTGRPSREVAYPLRAERGVPYSGLGAKRTYSAVDEEAAYYGSGPRSYPRARVEYGDPTIYSDPLRAASLGHASLGHVLPRGGHGYSSCCRSTRSSLSSCVLRKSWRIWCLLLSFIRSYFAVNARLC